MLGLNRSKLRSLKPLQRLQGLARCRWSFGRGGELSKQATSLIQTARRNSSIADNLDLLKRLHELFPARGGKIQYDLDALLARARARFSTMAARGIPIHGVDMLDLAAGNGENLLVAHEFGLRSATAIDYSADKFREHANGRPATSTTIEYVETNLDQVELPIERFDVAVSNNSFHLFTQPARLLEQCWRTLRPGGWFVAQLGPLFRSPWGAHRYSVTGVPYVQLLFSDATAYEFLYHVLRMGPETHRYSGAPLVTRDPYAELNRWTTDQFEAMFARDPRWRCIEFHRTYDYQFRWLAELARSMNAELSADDLFVSNLSVVLRKSN